MGRFFYRENTNTFLRSLGIGNVQSHFIFFALALT